MDLLRIRPQLKFNEALNWLNFCIYIPPARCSVSKLWNQYMEVNDGGSPHEDGSFIFVGEVGFQAIKGIERDFIE